MRAKFTRCKIALAMCAALVLHPAASPEASADAKFIPKNAKFKSKDKMDFGKLLFKDGKFKEFKATDLDIGKGTAIETYEVKFKSKIKSKGKDLGRIKMEGKLKKSFTETRKTGQFDTEIVALDLRGDLPGKSIKLKKASLPSMGMALFSTDKEPVLLESFFDVFFELSVDGGPPIEQDGGPARFTFARVPEPASLGLVVAGLVGLGVYRSRERRRKRDAR